MMIKCWVKAESADQAESAAYDVDWTSDNKADAESMWGPSWYMAKASYPEMEVKVSPKI